MRKKKIIGLVPTVLCVFLFVALSAVFYYEEGLSFSFFNHKNSFWGYLANMGVISALLLIQSTLHEIIHIVVAKLINPNAKLKFSLFDMGIGITPPKQAFSRVEFQIVSIMPFVVFCIPLILYYVFELKNEVILYFFLFNTSGSSYDFVAFFKAFAYPPQARYPR